VKRFFKYALLTPVLLIVALAGALTFVAATETGTSMAWNLAARFLPAGLAIEGIEGRLLGPLVVRGVDYQTRTFELHVRRGELRWRPADLWRARTLHVGLIDVQGVRYTQLRAAPERQPQKKTGRVKLPDQIDLPLDARLEKLRITDVEYRSARKAEPVILRRAQLGAAYVGSELTVDQLGVDAPLLTLRGTARLDASSAYPVDANLAWQARPPGYPAAVGRTALEGSLRRTLDLKQTVEAPYRTQAQVKIRDPLDQLSFDAQLKLSQVELRKIDQKLPPITLSAQVHSSGRPDDVEVQAQATVREPEYGILNLAFAGGFAQQLLTIDRLTLTSPDQPARLTAAGTAALGGSQPKVNFHADWEELRWPLSGQAQIESAQGRLDVDGTPDAVRARLRAALGGTALAQAGLDERSTLAADFRGGVADQLLNVDEFTASFAEQQLAVQGQVNLSGRQPVLNLEAQWRDLRWPLGGVALVTSPEGQLAVNGTPADLKARLDVALGEGGRIEGNVGRTGAQVEVALDWRDLRWPLMGAAQVRSPEGALDIDGQVSDLRAQLSANLAGPALSATGVPENQRLNVDFAGGFEDQTLAIDALSLALAAQPTRLTAAGQVALGGQPAFDLEIDWQELRWPLAGAAQVRSSQGRLTLDGPLADVRARLRAALDGRALGQAGVEEEQTLTLALDGGFEDQIATLDRLALEFMQQRLSGRGRVALRGPQPEFDLQASWEKLRWPLAGDPMMTSPAGALAVEGTPENLRTNLDVQVGADGRIEGSVQRRDEIIDLALNWRGLQWPLTRPQVISPAGELTVAGPLQDYRAQLTTQVEAPHVTDARIELAGRGSLESLDLSRIKVETLKGTIAGDARIAWKPALQGRVALDAEGLDPGQLAADWPGRLGFTLRAAGGMQENEPAAQFEELTVDGRLRGYPVQVKARGAYDAAGLELDQLRVASGDSELSASGTISESLDVNWRIRSPDLQQLLPDASGQLVGEGSAQGALQRPRVQAQLKGSDLRYQTSGLQSLALGADLDVSGARESRLNIEMTQGYVDEINLRRIALSGEGHPAAHRFDLTARTSSGHADLALRGALEDPWQPERQWQFALVEATLKYPQLAAWRLPAPLEGLISAARAELSRGCWVSDGARLCVQGERTPQATRASLEIQDLAFDYFAPLMPGTRLEGSVNGQLAMNVPPQGPPVAQVQLKTTAGRVLSVVSAPTVTAGSADVQQVVSQATNLLEFRPSEVDFDMRPDGMRLAAGLNLAQAGGIEVAAGVPEGSEPLAQRPLTGHIRADVPDLSFIGQLAPDLGRFGGRLEGEMRLAGSIEAPQLQGRVALEDGLAVLRAPGLRIRGIQVELIGQGAQGLRLAAAARSGGGTLNVNGQLQAAGERAPQADLQIRGVAFQAFNTPDARVFVSPDLSLQADAQRISVTGEVRVPRAAITPKKLPTSAVTVSGDQVIVRPGEEEPQATEVAGAKIYARVRLILGAETNDEIGEQITDKLDEPEVYIDAFGLTAGLEGELLIIEEPGEPTRGTGELNIVEGRYQAYGQDLVIETGRILFPGGPISEPGLEVRAIRGDLEDEDVVVGVQVRGSLKQPEFELFSEPSMTQQEQLSYLVLGRAPGEQSGGESSLLARAALALGLKGGNYLAENFGSRLGVDEIGFESSDTGTGEGEQASLVIGKYLSPRLYISYGIGLLEPVSTVRLEYAITNSLELVTESSGAQTGGDVIYTIERGQ
jgi:translocation and assembly module TamB